MARLNPMSRTIALDRAKSMVKKRIAYSLGAGGRDPWDSDPATGSIGDGDATCDCSGFVAWCLGYDRKQPASDFPPWGGWINTDSMIEASQSKGPAGMMPERWFEDIEPESAIAGDLVVYGGSRTESGGRRIGHVGLIATVPTSFSRTTEKFRAMRVIHCSGGNFRRFGYAVANTEGSIWHRRATFFLRYLRFVDG